MCGADVITSPEMPAADDAGCPYVITFIMQLWKFSLPGPSPQLLLFLPRPKLSVAHSEGDGVRSLGQLGAQGQLQRNPIPGFPHPSPLSEGAEGVDGWEKALLHLVEWKGITLEPGSPIPGISSSLDQEPTAPSSCCGGAPPPQNGLGDAEDARGLHRKAGLSLQGEGWWVTNA